jgi:hypothetical protein
LDWIVINLTQCTDCSLPLQACRHLLQEMHPQPVPRGRAEQGRVSLPRPLRIEVLRSQRQSFGEDAKWRTGEGVDDGLSWEKCMRRWRKHFGGMTHVDTVMVRRPFGTTRLLKGPRSECWFFVERRPCEAISMEGLSPRIDRA